MRSVAPDETSSRGTASSSASSSAFGLSGSAHRARWASSTVMTMNGDVNPPRARRRARDASARGRARAVVDVVVVDDDEG